MKHRFLTKNKYNARKKECDGYKFDSIREYLRYLVLRDRLKKNEIENLEIHPSYLITINGIKIGKVILDFRYFDKSHNKQIIEDVKGLDTAISKWKRKTVQAYYGIKVEIIK